MLGNLSIITKNPWMFAISLGAILIVFCFGFKYEIYHSYKDEAFEHKSKVIELAYDKNMDQNQKSETQSLLNEKKQQLISDSNEDILAADIGICVGVIFLLAGIAYGSSCYYQETQMT